MPEYGGVRRIPLLLVGALLGLVLAAPARAATVLEPYADAAGYAATLTATDGGRSWSGTQTITVRNAGGKRPLDRVWLRLWGNGPVGCAPQAVTLQRIDGARRGRLLRDCSALELLLPAPLSRGARATITLGLTITAPAIQDRFGSAEDIHLFGNALPVVAQRDRDGWRLPVYSPNGESFVTTVAPIKLTMHHPLAVRVAASGDTTTTDLGDGNATTTSEIIARDAMWAAGQMAVVERRTKRGTLVRSWSTPEALADREEHAALTVKSLQQLERRLPEYPYGELDVVIARIEAGGGMEYPGIILTDASDDVTRHEVAHQWFYALVGNDQYREPWVDEGFTSFLEYTWTAGDLPAPECIGSARLAYKNAQRFVTQSMSYWNRHVGQYLLVYNNPVCALRSVRAVLGYPKFERTMRKLVTDNAGGFLTGAEVRGAFRKAGGRRIDKIWVRWGLGPG